MKQIVFSHSLNKHFTSKIKLMARNNHFGFLTCKCKYRKINTKFSLWCNEQGIREGYYVLKDVPYRTLVAIFVLGVAFFYHEIPTKVLELYKAIENQLLNEIR